MTDIIIFLDWDDTLFPTSYLIDTFCTEELLGIEEIPQKYKNELEAFQSMLIEFFEKIFTITKKVHIVTHSKTGWVESLSEKYFPDIIPWLNRMSVLSAKSMFSHDDKGNRRPTSTWKQKAFLHLLDKEFETTTQKIIISIGDSTYEHDACASIVKNRINCISKTLKFMKSTDITILYGQLYSLTKSFDILLDYEKGDQKFGTFRTFK